MNKLRLGVIGIGNMGSEHCRTVLSGITPEIVLTAVADLREDRREWAHSRLPDNVSVFESGERLIGSGRCDAVLIATPHPQHPPLTIKALRHGLHVLCEKPIAVDMITAREMVCAARQEAGTFALMFNQRTNCLYRRLKGLLDSGELGAVKRVVWCATDWYRTQRYYDSSNWRGTWLGEGGGILMNQCPHQLDLLQWLFGMPVRVRAFCREGMWHNIETEDEVTAYLEFPGGAAGVFLASTGDLPGVNRLEVTLEQGRIVCENETLSVWKLPVSERVYCKTSPDLYAGISPVKIEAATDGQNTQHTGVLNAFAAHILHGAPLVASGEEGLNSLLLANAMYLSSWLDQPITLPMDEELFVSMLRRRQAASHLKEGGCQTYETDHAAGGRVLH